jgi:hypothetical protein
MNNNIELNQSLASLTKEELIKLCNIDNHKIVKLANGLYQWSQNINGNLKKLEETFYTRKEAYENQKLSLAIWRKELDYRQKMQEARISFAYNKLEAIKESTEKTTNEKILEIKELYINLSDKEIASELGISRQTVYRASKEPINQTSTRKQIVKDDRVFYNMNSCQEERIKSEEYLDYVASFKKEVEVKHKDFIEARDKGIYNFIDKLVNNCDLRLAS